MGLQTLLHQIRSSIKGECIIEVVQPQWPEIGLGGQQEVVIGHGVYKPILTLITTRPQQVARKLRVI